MIRWFKNLRKRWKAMILGGGSFVFLSPFVFMHYVHAKWSGTPLRAEGMTRTFVEFDGRDLPVYRVNERGTAYRVVFVHGTPGSASNFATQFREGIPNAELVAYERPGFEGKPLKFRDATLRYQTDGLIALLESMPPKPTIIVGHSYGGPVALQATIERPELASAALQIGGSVDPDLEETYWLQWLGQAPGFNLLPPRDFLSSNRELLRLRADLETLESRLKDLKTPVTMLHGTVDSLVPIENVDYLQNQLQELGLQDFLRLDIHEDVNHFIPWSHPHLLKESIEEQWLTLSRGLADRE